MEKNLNKSFWENYGEYLFSQKYNTGNIIHSISSIESNFLKEFKTESLLHIFCNFGMNTFSLKKYSKYVLGLDYNQQAIDFAKKYNDKIKSDVDFICEDFFNFNPNKKFDTIYASFGVLDWVHDLDLFLEKIQELLLENGKFILIEYHSDFFEQKFLEMGSKIPNTNQYEINTNFKKRVGTSKKSILGNGYDYEENIVMRPYLHKTSNFLDKLKKFNFDIKQIEFYDYITWKMGNDLKISPNKFRNKFLKEDQKMAFSLITQKIW